LLRKKDLIIVFLGCVILQKRPRASRKSSRSTFFYTRETYREILKNCQQLDTKSCTQILSMHNSEPSPLSHIYCH